MDLLERKITQSRLRSIPLVTTVLLILAADPWATYAQDELSRFRVMWLNGQYAEALPQLLRYRELPYGRNAEVDYMIATSGCRTGLREEAVNHFAWMLAYYSLTTRDRRVVEREMQECATGGRPVDISFVTQRTEVGVRGKTAFVPGNPAAPATSAAVEIVERIPPEEFLRRLFRLADREAAMRHAARLVGEGFQVAATDQFVLLSSSGHSSDGLLSIGMELERTLAFFNAEFGVPPPPYLITVYLVPSTSALQQLAAKIHGFRLPGESIGYSFQNDLSIAGWVILGDIGTLAHELFHLAVRNHFGDIPPWLDEGMAALYEESKFDQGRLIGQKNWRGQILQQFWGRRPTIELLVKMDWRSFDAFDARPGEKETCQAVNHATARYFALYFQDQVILPVVYKAFRNRAPKDAQGNPGLDAVRVLESTLRRQLVETDRAFAQWFGRPGGATAQSPCR